MGKYGVILSRNKATGWIRIKLESGDELEYTPYCLLL